MVLSARQGVAPASLDTETLVRALARSRVMITFFNDVDLGGQEDWIPAVCYFATKGFFPGYDARATEALDAATAAVWADAFGSLRAGTLDPMAVARQVAAASAARVVSAGEFEGMLGRSAGGGAPASGGDDTWAPGGGDAPITRGEACRRMFERLD
jgi:hypothetical protein